MGEAAAANLSIHMHSVDGQAVCRVHVKPSKFPVDATVTVVEDGKPRKKTVFYVRLPNKTAQITDEDEKRKYIAQQWGTVEG